MKDRKALSAKKSLGQNFLKSKKAIHSMINAANVSKNDLVIEIGPGKGALTKPILETGARVIAFELDGRMIEYLNESLSEYIQNGQLKIIHQDVLKIEMEDFFAELGNYKLVANIPYYITSAIFRKFLETEYQPTDITLLLQREVAERIVVRDNKQSILSLSVSVFGNAKYIGKVDRKYFSPSPKVHSAVIHIGDISMDRIGSVARKKMFFDLVHAGFAHKRKKLIRNLENIINKKELEIIFRELSLDENVRAEELDLCIWIQILDKHTKK